MSESAVAAVERDLAEIAKVDAELARGSIAAVARAFARDVDSTANSATQRAGAGRALVEVMVQLRALAPKGAQAGDVVDDLAKARTERRERAMTA